MTITTIIYRAANTNMGDDCCPAQCDAFRAWALEQIQNEYPDVDVSVEDSEHPSEVYDDEGNDIDDVLAYLSSLWDACPWDFDC